MFVSRMDFEGGEMSLRTYVRNQFENSVAEGHQKCKAALSEDNRRCPMV